MTMPADIRASFIGAAAQMVADEIAGQPLHPATAERITAVLAGIVDAASELRAQLAPLQSKAAPAPAVDPVRSPTKVVALREWKRRR